MRCPSDDRLLLAVLGELTVNEARALEQHRGECARCRAQLREHDRLLCDLRAAPPLPSSADAFTAGVLAACDQQPASLPGELRRRRAPLALSSLAAAAALCIGVPWYLARDVDRAAEHWTARGGGEREQQISADVLLVRDGALRPLSGAVLSASDALAVRCTNDGDRELYLAVFAVDARGTAHWIYPAYLDPADNPTSVAIAPHVRDRLLDEVVAPEAPAEGPLRVFAVFTPAPVGVKEFEKHLAEFEPERPAPSFARAHVQEWRVSWAMQ